jgi:polysaccharide deacetylase family protein (PEP-CTERM system associated)
MKATFFVLGWVAERYPELVRQIYDGGHEVACHGYSHDLIYNQSPDVFKEETILSKSILEDIIQEPVIGYRAASYSITSRSLWALDILAELGFKYDSSIFPIRHDRYGIPSSETLPYKLEISHRSPLIEFPLSTLEVLKQRIPISGGGYFRIFPYYFTKKAFHKKNRRGEPIVFYLHPWEIDPEQPRIKSNLLSSFRHYYNISKCESRLNDLINNFRFTRIDNLLHELELL